MHGRCTVLAPFMHARYAADADKECLRSWPFLAAGFAERDPSLRRSGLDPAPPTTRMKRRINALGDAGSRATLVRLAPVEVWAAHSLATSEEQVTNRQTNACSTSDVGVQQVTRAAGDRRFRGDDGVRWRMAGGGVPQGLGGGERVSFRQRHSFGSGIIRALRSVPAVVMPRPDRGISPECARTGAATDGQAHCSGRADFSGRCPARDRASPGSSA
jgi:hypothetical protein